MKKTIINQVVIVWTCYQRNKIDKVIICNVVGASADLQQVPSSKPIQLLQ